jgi:hypothetical protein
MEQLCTLAQAKVVLGVYDDTQDSEIEEAVTMSSAVILDYCQIASTTGLSEIKIECLRAGCLRLVGIIYDGTGEKTPNYSQANGELPRSVTMLINRVKRNIIA